MLSLVQSLSSSIFRLLAYIFLQIIPTRLFRFAIPALFTTFLVSTWLSRPPKPKKSREEKDAPPEIVRRPSWLWTLCFSLPTTSPALTLANVVINSIIFAAFLDCVLPPFFDSASEVVFTRVGAVYPDSVKIVARVPQADTLTLLYHEVTAHAQHPEPFVKDSTWIDALVLNPVEAKDWVVTAQLTNLRPDTAYEYILETVNTTIPARPIPFRTFADPRLHSASVFRFVASSCTSPNFPYRGPQHRRSIRGFDLLADYLHEKHAEFMLFLGDFIYADVPFYVGDDQEAYRRLYRRNFASPSYRRIYERIPVFHAYDDHEFIDNFAGASLDVPPFVNGSNAYSIYAGNANYDPVSPDASYYAFTHGAAAFFVLDTRRYRSGPSPDATMLGEAQLAALADWLHAVNASAAFKVVVSSVPFTELFTYDAKIDTWAGYPTEKARVLALLQSVQGVVVISGDRHQFAAVEFAPLSNGGHMVYEVSTSPLSMFGVPVNAIDRATTDLTVSADGVVRPRERVLEYIPAGNYKWSAFEVDTRDAVHPVMRIETVIDGIPVYHLEVPGMPVRTPPAGLGAIVSTNVRGLFDRIGLSPLKWF